MCELHSQSILKSSMLVYFLYERSDDLSIGRLSKQGLCFSIPETLLHLQEGLFNPQPFNNDVD